MNAWELPASLNIGGAEFSIRTDFRVILDLLSKLSSPEYEDDERGIIFLMIMYPEWQKIPTDAYQEALEKAKEFIDAGFSDDGRQKPRLMDWEQDAPVVIPAINRVLGKEIRAVEHLHWWTFMAAYMEIGESLFSSILSVRQKKAKGKKLEKHEATFYKDNKSLIDLKKKYTEEEKAEQERLKALLG